MKHIFCQTILLFAFSHALLIAQIAPPFQPDGTQSQLGVEACNFVETTGSDPNWVLATSDRILRRTLCTASPPCAIDLWYESIENPCYGDVRYYKLTDESVFGAAFSMSALGTGTFDGLYIREGYTFQLYYGDGDTVPFGEEQSGSKFVSIDYWIPYACDGFEPDTIFVVGDPGALSDYSIKVTNSENLDPKLCFRVDCPLTVFGPGHVFIDIYPGSGDQKCETLAYGFYPGSWKIFGGIGKINNEDTRPWDYQICYSINVLQYKELASVIQESIQNPDAYNLKIHNCTDWAGSLANRIGLMLPPYVNRVGISDPLTFWTALRIIGNGGTFAGGVVSQNTNNRLHSGTLDLGTPGTLSYGFVVDALHARSAELAAAIGHVFRENQLPALQLANGDKIEIILGNILLNEAVTSVDWGDGSAPSINEEHFSHQFDVPGVYMLSIGVLNNGAVNHYLAEVTVTAQKGFGQTHTIMQSVPTDPPATALNQGFTAPINPLAIPIGFYNTLGAWPNHLTVLELISEVVNQ